jgi:hypothetical protein
MAIPILDQIRTVEQQKMKVKTETLRKVKQALKELNKLGLISAWLRMGEWVSELREARGLLKMCPAEFADFAL